MKILLVQDRLRSGGTERQTFLLGRAFAEAGHETTLLTFRPGGALEPKRSRVVPPIALKGTHRSHPFGIRSRSPSPRSALGPQPDKFSRVALQPVDFHLDWFAPGLIRRAAELSPDIVLCMGRMANCYGGCLQARLPRAAVVATMRTGKALPWLFRRSLRRARHIVANSLEARDLLEARLGLPPEKMTVIRNALVFPPDGQLDRETLARSATIQSARDETLRTRWGAGRATTVLLCVAMFRPEKNQAELIEIASGLPAGMDWALWLAGDGPALERCRSLVRRRALEDRIKFLGFQPDAGPIYASADVAVHASGTESLSNFIIEAQAHGLPAVVCAAQGIRECVIPERTGWIVAPGDRPAFRAAVAALIEESPAARAERGREAQAFARAQFDPGRQVQAYLDLFRRLKG